jgi:hypothetical protein
MKIILAAILLSISVLAQAESELRSLSVICGTQEEMAATLKAYQEVPYIVGVNKEAGLLLSLWVNMTTGTSSWVAKIIATNEFCMIGTGTELIIPKDSPLQEVPIGTRVIFKQAS